MTQETASNVGPARITIAYERFGDGRAPPVLLVMGLAAQMIHWPDGFCEALASSGLHVVRFDNRDAGASTHFSEARNPDFAAAVGGDVSSAAYTLSDMAADTAGLLDALGIESAHVVGMSMGGMIAQTLVIEHRARVLSLTSISATTGERGVGQPSPQAVRALIGPAPKTRAEAIERGIAVSRIMASPGFPSDEDEMRERVGRAFDRGHDPAGVARQAVATMASGDRTAKLKALDVPALVIHGADDVICDPSGGRATARAIPGAQLVVIDGMGHNLPRGLWPRLTELISGIVNRVESASLSA